MSHSRVHALALSSLGETPTRQEYKLQEEKTSFKDIVWDLELQLPDRSATRAPSVMRRINKGTTTANENAKPRGKDWKRIFDL